MNIENQTNNQRNKTNPKFYHLFTGETIEEPVTRFKLFDNYSDTSNTFIEIEFYLPEDTNAKLILLDSDKLDTINLIDKELKAGRHIYKSQICLSELKYFRYYFKLEAYGYNEVKEMHLTC